MHAYFFQMRMVIELNTRMKLEHNRSKKSLSKLLFLFRITYKKIQAIMTNKIDTNDICRINVLNPTS